MSKPKKVADQLTGIAREGTGNTQVVIMQKNGVIRVPKLGRSKRAPSKQ